MTTRLGQPAVPVPAPVLTTLTVGNKNGRIVPLVEVQVSIRLPSPCHQPFIKWGIIIKTEQPGAPIVENSVNIGITDALIVISVTSDNDGLLTAWGNDVTR